MPRPYSDDLRRKVLEAHAAGRGSMRSLAAQFGVSQGWVEKIARQHRQHGRIERVQQRHGPPSRAGAEAEECLREALREQPDRTLVELQQVLRTKLRIGLSVAQLWRVVGRLGLPLKKSHSTLSNGTRKKTANAVRSSSKSSVRSRRRS